MGDYADHLPAGYTLVVCSVNTHEAVQWLMPGGTFTNDGMIELRHGGWNWQGYPRLYWETDGTLAGSGEVYLSGAGDWNLLSGAEGVTLTVGASQWVHGRGAIEMDVVNDGTLEADLVNQSLIVVGSVDNLGTLAASEDAGLEIRGDLRNDELVQALGGRILATGSIQLGSGAAFDTQDDGFIRIGRHFWGSAADSSVFAANATLILDGGGTAMPDLSASAFFTEAEDFNYDRGQHMSTADSMPYFGGDYELKAGRDRIDYHVTANDLFSDVYRSGEGPGMNVNIAALNDLDRGSYQMQTNYVIGWNEPDEWYNYTRIFPASTEASYLFARLSSLSLPYRVEVDLVIGGADTTSQVLDKLGEIHGPASGDWNAYAYEPLRDEAGDLLPITWTDEVTFRATMLGEGGQNVDCYVLAPAVSSGPFQLLEVMGTDRGATLDGFSDNFEVGSLTLTEGSHAQLVDLDDNSPGGEPEAIYVSQLTVPIGAVLDLNGLNLYTEDAVVEGDVINGAVIEVRPEAPLLRITQVTESLEIRWPIAAGSFELQSSVELTSAAVWQRVTTVPLLDGADNLVVEIPGGTQRFYRLHHP